MLKKYLIFFFIFSVKIYSNNLIEKEIYFDQDKKIIGEKHFIYNLKNNISQIYTFQNNKLESKTEYIYDNNQLLVSEDYISSKTMLGYSVYYYTNSKITKKVDYNPDEEILFVHIYIFDKTGSLAKLELRSAKNQYQGERKFIYNDNKIIEELHLDDKKRIILKKKYIYVNNIIKNIEIYDENGIKLRVIERTYMNKSDKISYLGLRENFYDFK
ncbi:MAG: hypothetical protein JXB50_05265 [Spirochaetes bacterium]|nr:hypothetical protein [Spirochaetota bacterium]